MISEQSLDSEAYGYLEEAVDLQLNNDNKHLQQISSDKGYQWSLEFGRYF